MQKQIPPRRAGGVEYALASQGVEFSVASLQKGKLAYFGAESHRRNLPDADMMLCAVVLPSGALGGYVPMAANKHMELSQRIRIETMLNDRKSFKSIAKELDKDCTTVLRLLFLFPFLKKSLIKCPKRIKSFYKYS